MTTRLTRSDNMKMKMIMMMKRMSLNPCLGFWKKWKTNFSYKLQLDLDDAMYFLYIFCSPVHDAPAGKVKQIQKQQMFLCNNPPWLFASPVVVIVHYVGCALPGTVLQ